MEKFIIIITYVLLYCVGFFRKKTCSLGFPLPLWDLALCSPRCPVSFLSQLTVSISSTYKSVLVSPILKACLPPTLTSPSSRDPSFLLPWLPKNVLAGCLLALTAHSFLTQHNLDLTLSASQSLYPLRALATFCCGIQWAVLPTSSRWTSVASGPADHLLSLKTPPPYPSAALSRFFLFSLQQFLVLFP